MRLIAYKYNLEEKEEFLVPYRRKRKKGRIVFAICLLLLLVGFTYGYISNNKPLNKPDNISELADNNEKDVRKVNENKVVEDSKREDDETGKGDILERGNKVKVDSEIVFNTYYVKFKFKLSSILAILQHFIQNLNNLYIAPS